MVLKAQSSNLSRFKMFLLKFFYFALAGMVKLVEHHPMHQKVTGSYLGTYPGGQGTYSGGRFEPSMGVYRRQPINVPLTLVFLSPPLKSNNN